MLLPVFSFNDAIHMVFPLKGFTLKWYDQMIHSSRLHRALMNSIKVEYFNIYIIAYLLYFVNRVIYSILTEKYNNVNIYSVIKLKIC